MTPASPVRPPVPCRCRCRSSPPGSGSWSRPAAPDTAPGGPACASSRTPPASDPRTDAHAARSSPSPEGRRRGQCVAYSFDEIDHTALMDRVRHRIGDKRVLGLVKAFLRAGILTEEGLNRETITGTPQGGILSPLLANIALSVLDEHFTAKWDALGPRSTRGKQRRAGVPVMRIVRYADDFVVMVAGTRSDAEALWDEVASVLAPMGLRLSEEKTRVCHIDEGFDFLGWRIQRRNRRGRSGKQAIYTYPSKEALAAIVGKVRSLTRRGSHRRLADLLRRLNPVLRGWCNYFRHGVSQRTFSYVDYFAFWRVFGWLHKRHLGLNKHTLVRRHLPDWKISDDGVDLFRPEAVAIVRCRYRGSKIPTPWTSATTGPAAPAA